MYPFAKLPLCDPVLVTVTVTAPSTASRSRGCDRRAVRHHHVGCRRLPKVTVAPAAKFVPAMVTAVPPVVDPVFGATLLTVGGTM